MTDEETPSGSVARVRRERDLYRRLLELGEQKELEPFLEEALVLVVEATGARNGYLELQDPDDRSGGGRRWSFTQGLSADEVDNIRRTISRGIIAEAMANGQTVITASAFLDPRFKDRQSVRAGRIEAVLCAPIGRETPIGVLYLHGREPAGQFSDEDRANAEIFARHLAPLADRLLSRRRLREETDQTRSLRETLRLEGVIGRSPALAAVLRQAALAAPLNVTVLLTGESGTGKSQLARVIHDNGPRRTKPFVEVNCAAVPETLMESELFGALAGAHSTATHRMEGKVSAAEHGTLLLDEVAELSPSAQAKLLHLLQSRQYYPLGGTKPVQADVRIIAATNTDLQAAITAKRFREDLFYRLDVLPIRMPSLSERREDIPELAAHFCTQVCRRHRLPQLTLSPGAMRAIESAEWRGHVRQLAHCVEAAAIRAAGEGAERVESIHLFPNREAANEEVLTFQAATRRFQGKLLRETLEAYGWNVVETAQRLDLARSHVYNLIRAFGVERQKVG